MARIAAAFPDPAAGRCRCGHRGQRLRLHRLAAGLASRPCPRRAGCRQKRLREKPLAVDVTDARAFVASAGERGAVNFPFASSLAVATLQDWIAQGEIGTVSRIAIEVAFATWPRSWQADAAAWLDKPAQGGFTREVVSHFLFLSRRLLGPLHGLSASANFPEAGKAERAIEARLFAGEVPVVLKGGVGTTAKDDHNIWMLEGDKGAVRLCDWSIAERRLPDGSWQRAPDARCPTSRPARSP
jgi:predicted dehydrogenase